MGLLIDARPVGLPQILTVAPMAIQSQVLFIYLGARVGSVNRSQRMIQVIGHYFRPDEDVHVVQIDFEIILMIIHLHTYAYIEYLNACLSVCLSILFSVYLPI